MSFYTPDDSTNNFTWNFTNSSPILVKYCNDADTPVEYYDYGQYVFFVCPPISILLNTVVLFIIYKNVKVHDRYSQWFVLGFTFSDLMLAITLISTSPYFPTVKIPRLACKPYFASKFYFSITLVMFLLCLNVNRFVKLFLPLKFHRFVSRRTTFMQIGFVICVPLAFILYLTVTLKYQFENEYSCRVYSDWIPYTFMLIFFYASPLVLSFVISLSIFILAQRKSATDNNGRDGGGKLFKRILFVFSYTAWTAVTQLPYRISYIRYVIFCQEYLVSNSFRDWVIKIAKNSVTEEECYHCSDTRYLIVLACLIPLCSLLNPVITIITQKQYRKGLQMVGHGMASSISNLARLSNGNNNTNYQHHYHTVHMMNNSATGEAYL